MAGQMRARRRRLERTLTVTFALLLAGVVFLFIVVLVGVGMGQMLDALTPPLSYVPLAGTLLVALAAAASTFRACGGRRSQHPPQ
jgi:H+/Cl- antiporter ClcA